jgi:DNA-binding CsgD family transcriptional regulator
MNDLTLEWEHPSIRITPMIISICEQLFKSTCINGFSHSRVFPDGSRQELWSNSKALKHTFLEKKYICRSYTPDLFDSKERYVFLPHKVLTYDPTTRDAYLRQLADQKNIFNHDYAFMLIKKDKHFCEYNIFYSETNKQDALNFYLNNLALLEGFVDFFKTQVQANKIINKIQGHPIVAAWRNPQLSRQICHTTGIQQSSPVRNFLPVKLTCREIEVCHKVILGESSSEISSSLYISAKTVNRHIENVKVKLGVCKKSELIKKLRCYFTQHFA